MARLLLPILLVAAGAAAAVPAPAPVTPSWVDREAYLMGTVLRIRVGGADRAHALSASEAALRSVEETEELLSTWREDTPLARANRVPPGSAAPLGPELAALLSDAFALARSTGGAFEPAVGALVDAWGLRADGRRPSPEGLARALSATGRGGVRLGSDGTSLTRLHVDAWVDAGGFGKGAALRRASGALKDRGAERALLDFGGQLLALGSGPEEGTGWPVAVAHPTDRDRPVVRLRVTDASVATTGASERFVEVEGERLGHVLDPRTGRPVRSWGSVTVVARDPLAADALTTGLYVLGPDEALAWARERPEVGVLTVEVDGPGSLRVRWSDGMEPWLAEAPVGDPARAGDATKKTETANGE